MRVEQCLWSKKNGWQGENSLKGAQLVLYFGGKGLLDCGERYRELAAMYPNAHLLGCSTGGEIHNSEVWDDSIVAAALHFEKTSLRAAVLDIAAIEDSFAAGKKLGEELKGPGLSNIFLLSDGTNVNGSDLVNGLYSVLDKNIIVTGGLAGDAADFGVTLVGLDAPAAPRRIAAVGFYGDALKVGYGSVGGWNAFGPKRRITKSKANVLYELDGRPALDLYKQYLGPEAAHLPGSALLFPLNVHPDKDPDNNAVRTVVGVDEKEKTMTFAGDMPEGSIAQLMQGDFNNLVDGAGAAAELARAAHPGNDSIAILVSCIGRKLLLGQRISDETEAVAAAFGYKVPTIGFYSYGEICHRQFTGECGLHNQTMTVTVLHEV